MARRCQDNHHERRHRHYHHHTTRLLLILFVLSPWMIGIMTGNVVELDTPSSIDLSTSIKVSQSASVCESKTTTTMSSDNNNNNNNNDESLAFLDGLRRQYAHQPTFLQAVEEMAVSLLDLFEDPIDGAFYRKAFLVMTEPERIIGFRVRWEDDHGNMQWNRAWRIEFNRYVHCLWIDSPCLVQVTRHAPLHNHLRTIRIISLQQHARSLQGRSLFASHGRRGCTEVPWL